MPITRHILPVWRWECTLHETAASAGRDGICLWTKKSPMAGGQVGRTILRGPDGATEEYMHRNLDTVH